MYVSVYNKQSLTMYVQLPALQQCPAGHSLTGLLQPLSWGFHFKQLIMWHPRSTDHNFCFCNRTACRSQAQGRVGRGGGASRSHILDYNKASWSCWPTSHIRGVVLCLGLSLNCTKPGESVDAHSENCVMWMLAKEANERICLRLPVMLVDTMVCRFWYSRLVWN